MKNQTTCLDLLEKLHITPVDAGNDDYKENTIFWHEDFSDFITLPSIVCEKFDLKTASDIFRILSDYAFRRGFTAAKLQYERGLCYNTNPYIQANSLTNDSVNQKN
jgi:hypothetical protein